MRLGFITSILFLFLIPSVLATNYEFTGYTTVNYIANSDYGISFDKSISNCKVKMGGQNSFVSASTFDTTMSWYSPDTTNIGYSTLTGISNTSCRSWGYSPWVSISPAANFYETKSTYTQSAYSGFVTTSTSYSCPPNSGEWINFTIPGYQNDSRGYCAWRKQILLFTGGIENGSLIYHSSLDYLADNYNKCGNSYMVNWTKKAPWYDASCFSQYISAAGKIIQFIYPFNASGGEIKYSIMETQAKNIAQILHGSSMLHYHYYDLIDLTTKTHTMLINGSYKMPAGGSYSPFVQNYSGGMTLTEDGQYLLVVTSIAPIGSVGTEGFQELYPPDLNLSIMTYHAKWDCGPWSPCVDGQKFRNCIDSLGISAQKTEPSVCDITILENATLGFEDSYEVPDTTICKSQWAYCTGFWGALDCCYNPLNITTERPLNWIVQGDYPEGIIKRYFMDFTSEWATEGSRSLKMWTQPPMSHNIDSYGITCTNTTFFYDPRIYQNMSNESFAIGYNVTFPATNMRIRFDVARCLNPVKQNDIYNAWGQNPNATFFTPIWERFGYFTYCPADCYSNDCNSQPSGSLSFDIKDETGISLIKSPFYYIVDDNDKKTINIDLSAMGIIAGHNYTIYIGMKATSYAETKGNCLMFDNIRYDVLDQPFISILPGGQCISGCVGTSYYTAKIVNGKCLVAEIPYLCDDEHKPEITNKEPFCEEDGITLNFYNNITRGRETKTCQYGCKNAHCLTKGEAEEEAAAAPPTTTTDYWAIIIKVPFLISIALCAICLIVTAIAPPAWPIGLFGLAQFIFILSVYNVISPFIAWGEIIMGIAILAYLVSKPAGG